MKLALASLIAFAVGFACRWFDLPAPAPPALQGALLVVAVTLGYASAGWVRGAGPAGGGVPAAVSPAAPAGGQAADAAGAGRDGRGE